MKIKYQTKEESNRVQEEEFLAMSYSDKFDSYLNMLVETKRILPIDNKNNTNNFLIEIYLE